MIDSVDIDKIKVIISYLSEKIYKLHVTKLLKLFYYIDFISCAERGDDASITNDIYYKLPYGPVPSFIKSEIDNLEGAVIEDKFKSQFADIIRLKESEDSYGKLVVSKGKKYDLRKISPYEKKLIDEIIKKLGGKTASFLTKKTHKEKPYLLTGINSVIDYSLANELGGRKVLN